MNTINETLAGIVLRVTYHNEENGWSVLRVQPFGSFQTQETVTVHQTKVFAGATMEFHGNWTVHPKFGRQFKANEAIEKKPASAAALEKYLGSGLIKGVGPKTAQKIVEYFGKDTLEVFEGDIEQLIEVPGIAEKKLLMIENAWREHREIREVMIFLQGHGISTLFAVRIYKKYADKAIELVSEDPYRLANDFYGIGFFSADNVALSIGLEEDSPQRLTAAIKHVLASSRDQGHCYLTEPQIIEQVEKLLKMDLSEYIPELLAMMFWQNHLRIREISREEGILDVCYYSKTLYYDEDAVAKKILDMMLPVNFNTKKALSWIDKYCTDKKIPLSPEQAEAVIGVVGNQFSVLTGGPGCGKTTTTNVIVQLILSMNKNVLLAAPTGRAAQRMSEVIGREAKTLHRLLEWKGGSFQKNENQPLYTDFLIVDECSMLDISLAAAVLKAVPLTCQVLFIGDPDQLPSVGAGNVLRDIISSGVVACFRLTKVFRQAQQSMIVRYAHQINKGESPYIASPFKKPEIWKDGTDCMFLDSDEATKEQMTFISKVKRSFGMEFSDMEKLSSEDESPFKFDTCKDIVSPYGKELVIPDKFQHVNLKEIVKANEYVDELKAVLKKVHPWSSLHFGMSAIEVVVKLYTHWIPKYLGKDAEIQILSPMIRGSLGTHNLNKVIQSATNPPTEGKRQLQIGDRVFREGDRVIHRKNNYDLNVFNGDIGKLLEVDNMDLTCKVCFSPNDRIVQYKREDITQLELAYAITIHKSQGSEFQAVIIPVLTQHFKMLFRNLIYTGLTRAKKMGVFVGTRKAMFMAIKQQDTKNRQTALKELLREEINAFE